MITLPKNTIPNNSSTHTSLNQCLGVVLAGGLSSRMGIDKSSLVRNEVSMLNYSKQLLTESGLKNIVVSGQSSSASNEDTVIADLYQQAGPVGGIASIIQQCKPSALLILPVDLPLMTFSALQKLKHIGEISQQACFYEDNYLPLYLPVNAHVEQFLQNAFVTINNSNNAVNNSVNSSGNNTKTNPEKNGPSIRALLKQIPHKALKIENPKTLFNSNTPEQWKTAQATFSTSGLKN